MGFLKPKLLLIGVSVLLAAGGTAAWYYTRPSQTTAPSTESDSSSNSSESQTKTPGPPTADSGPGTSSPPAPAPQDQNKTAVTFSALNPSTTSVKAGANINVISKVSDPKAQTVLTAENGSTVKTFSPESVGPNGELSWTFSLPTPGTWTLAASGTGSYSGFSNPISITVTP